MSSKPMFDYTPTRKSPRLLEESSPKVLSGPSFDLGCFTPSPVNKSKKKVFESESTFNNQMHILSNKIEFPQIEAQSVQPIVNMQSEKTPKKDFIPQVKRKYKRKNIVCDHNSDSDFEDERPSHKSIKLKSGIVAPSRVTRSRSNVTIVKDVDKKVVSKKKSRKVCKEKKTYSHWSSYIKVNVFDDLRKRWKKEHFQNFAKTPFGHFLNMQHLKVQPQLLRNLLHAETENDRDDLFIFSLNGKILQFGKREFSVVSGFKFDKKCDFFSDPSVQNKLMDRYYPGMEKIKRSDFYSDFVDVKDKFMEEDLYKIGMIYFIIRFLAPDKPSSFITKFYFDLVDSGQYLNYDWGNECFKVLKKTCRHGLKSNPSSFTFGGFHLALQIWFYECCLNIDKAVASRVDVLSPRILNWKSSQEIIYNEYLKSTMFMRYSNEYEFKDIVFTDEEMVKYNLTAIHQDRFFQEAPRYAEDVASYLKDDAFIQLRKELANVRADMLIFNDKILAAMSVFQEKFDNQLKEMKEYVAESVKLILSEIRSSKQDSSEFTEKQKPCPTNAEVVLETPESSKLCGKVLAESIKERDAVFDGVSLEMNECTVRSNIDGISPVNNHSPLDDLPFFSETQLIMLEPTFRKMETPKSKSQSLSPVVYDKSPVVMQNAYGSIPEKSCVYFKKKHPFTDYIGFEVPKFLTDQFTDWCYSDSKKRRERITKSSSEKINISPEFELGGLKIAQKSWFHTLIDTGRPWNDEHVDVIMYYLRKKAKYNVMKPITYTTTDVWFIKWICSIEKQWLNANRDMRYISPEHYIGQYIRGFKMLANVPWDTVDNIIIPVNVGESFHWIMVVFRIRLRCLYVYDSLIGGAVNTKNVQHLVQSLATMIPLFLVATEFYGKRADINWHREPAYMDKSMTDPLEYVLLKDAPQQAPNSNDCGMFVCAFAEFVSHGVFEISSINFNASNHRLRYGALLWDYARKKQDDGAISESEVTGNVTSRLGGPKISREVVPDVQKLHRFSLKNRKM